MAIDPLAEIRLTFFAECEELIEALTDGLSALAAGNVGKDTVNAVFRAVHSIKGGASAFGFEALVQFAHLFETAMDELRSGRIPADAPNVAIFFRSADHLADQISHARGGRATDPTVEAQLLDELESLVQWVPEDDTVLIQFEPTAVSLNDFSPVNEAGPSRFIIRFVPFPELFASGNDPLFVLSELASFGYTTIHCATENLPDLEDLDPQVCYLSWTIELQSAMGIDAIREAGAFVEGLCRFDVTELESVQNTISPQALPAFDPEDEAPLTPDLVSAAHFAVAPSPQPEPTTAPLDGSPRPQGNAAPNWAFRNAGPKLASEAKPRDSAAEQRPTVRVDLDRIDRLVNLVGELVINQSMLSQEISAAGLAKNTSIAIGLEEFLHLSRNIQESVMMIRAQPIKPLFSRMARTVRETALEAGKQVRLHTEGENTEIDKTLVERLADPLNHMIRNAIDHGLEKADVRRANGKSPEGVVTLSAGHRSGRVVIEVRDDGAGIDRPKVLATAIRKGLVPADQAMSDSDIDSLLFLAGFSTASVVSNLSGRGVGMDVVRNAIQDIGGRISIFSEPGKGTTFSISLPLTLAVLDGMVVQVADERIVVPLSAILETLTLNTSDVSDLGNSQRIVKIRDGFVSLLDLGVELGYRDLPCDSESAVLLLIAQDNGNPVAIAVDRIEEQRQVVIKGIEKNYGRVPGIAAATILGDGSIALILDPADFVALACGSPKMSTGQLALAG